MLEGQHARLSGPALETLAIIAYKQPISRGQMSAIRGVNVEATLTTLLQRGYVQEVGRDPGPGAAVLYGTTREFLERLGLPSLDDLPPLGDFVPDASVVEALERGLRVSDDPQLGDRRPRPTPPSRRPPTRRLTADRARPSTRASGSRRSSRAPGLGSRRVCEELIADGRVTVNGEVAHARAARRSRARRRSRSTACP